MAGTQLSQVTWRSHFLAALAIARKDWLHFFRYPMNAIFRVIEPVAWVTPIYFLSRSFATPQGNVGFAGYAGTTDYVSFLLLGGLITNYVSAVFWGMGFSLKTEMDSGVLESNWLTPVPRPVFLVGQTLASMSITTVNSAGTLVLAWLFFGFRITGNLLAGFSVLIPTLVALYGFGFAFAALVLLMRDANTLVDVSNYLLSMFAGREFPVQVLPWFLLPVSLALPLTYGYDALRGYLLNTRTILPIPYEWAILLAFMAVMVFLGFFVFEGVEQRCKRLGTLSMH